jgi:hypothetical protein
MAVLPASNLPYLAQFEFEHTTMLPTMTSHMLRRIDLPKACPPA